MQKDKGRVGLWIEVILFESRVVSLEVLGFLLCWNLLGEHTGGSFKTCSRKKKKKRHAVDKFESYCLLFKICLCF